MKRILVCLTALLILAALVGCGRNNQPPCGGEDFLPTTTPTATPTAEPTATPTPAPLTFQDLLDKSNDEEIVLTTYSLIDSANSYNYGAFIHRLYIKDGTVRMVIEIPEHEDIEFDFTIIEYKDSHHVSYDDHIYSEFSEIQNYDNDLYGEWKNYITLLEKVEGVYEIRPNQPIAISSNTSISKIVIWQQDYTFYVHIMDQYSHTLSTRSGKYEDDTFANLEVDWDFMDLVENSHESPIAFKEYEHIKNPDLSSLHYIDLSIKNGVCYLGETELSLAYTENFEFVFESSLYFGAHADAFHKDKGIAVSQYEQMLMQHLESSHECYVTSSEDLAIYQVGNTLYFLYLYKSDAGVNTCWFIFAKTIE